MNIIDKEKKAFLILEKKEDNIESKTDNIRTFIRNSNYSRN